MKKYLWRVMISHGIMQSPYNIVTDTDSIVDAATKARALADDETQFIPAAEIRSIEYAGEIAA